MSRFQDEFVELFHEQFRRIYRLVDRLSGDPDLAADLAQEAFVRLYQRGSSPDSPGAWLATVAMNLLRNARTTEARRARLLREGHEAATAIPPSGQEARVRGVLDRMPERERRLLLMQAEGFRYREIASALALNEASIGTTLARAKRMFRELYEETGDAPRG